MYGLIVLLHLGLRCVFFIIIIIIIIIFFLMLTNLFLYIFIYIKAARERCRAPWTVAERRRI
jgi:hypothetical protein